jgi:prepilin-type N-terminal cleavage/methylation domain-containing protein
MKRKMLRQKKGFTLIEVLVVMAIIGVVISMSFNLIIMPTRVYGKSVTESEIQFKLRTISQSVNTIVREASATFALPRTNRTNLTAGWNYIIPRMDISSTQSTSIIEYTWNDDTQTHDSRVIASPLSGVTYNLVFTKLNPSNVDNLLEYKIIATVDGQTREVQSEVEALNSLQVIDKGSVSVPSNTLAYRIDARPTQISDVKAAITMVLDKSGSMAWDMNGHTTYTQSNTRIYKLKQEAVRLIEGLSSSPNIYASIIPFESTANNPQEMLPVRVNDAASDVLINKINSMTAGGGTNVGDGLRRAYYITEQFSENTTSTVNNFMIILVDGVTTFYSATRVNASYWGTITSVNYVFGDNNIDDQEISNYNTTYPNGRYGGYGNQLDPWGTRYVDEIGAMILDFGSGATADYLPIRAYVIGFSADHDDFGSLGDIAAATTGSTVYYQAGDETALEAIFASIQDDINDSLWHIGGPN